MAGFQADLSVLMGDEYAVQAFVRADHQGTVFAWLDKHMLAADQQIALKVCGAQRTPSQPAAYGQDWYMQYFLTAVGV